MKNLIIYAHPKTGGHCEKILSEVEKRLKLKKEKYEVLDLYKMKYDPVMHKNELYTAGNKDVSNVNKKIQKKVLEADKLIFVYPLWWSGMPAIMKGFIDKVFVSGFAFRYVKGLPRGLLKGKKADVFVTSGAPKLFYWLIEGNRGIKQIKKDILAFCGIKAKVHHLGGCTKFDDKQKEKIIKMVMRSGL